MFKDKKKNMNVTKGDIVYLYEYKNRQNIESFEDLTRVVVTEHPQKNNSSEDIIANGEYFDFDENKNVFLNTMLGIVEYKKNGDFIETQEGNKIISYYIENNKPIFCLKKDKPSFQYYHLYIILELEKELIIKLKLFDDLVLTSVEDTEKLIQTLDIKNCELHSESIFIEINKDLYFYPSFEIYHNDIPMKASNKEKELYKYMYQKKYPSDVLKNPTISFHLKIKKYEIR